MSDEQRFLCRRIFDHYGVDSQLRILQEECAELIQAASKLCRQGVTAETYSNFEEELADVSIMIEQMKYWLKDDLTSIIDTKLQRQKERIAHERHGE